MCEADCRKGGYVVLIEDVAGDNSIGTSWWGPRDTNLRCPKNFEHRWLDSLSKIRHSSEIGQWTDNTATTIDSLYSVEIGHVSQ